MAETNNAWLTKITGKITRRIPNLNTSENNERINDLIETEL